MINISRILFFLLVSVVAYAQGEVNTITIEVKNIENSEGQLLIGLYDSEENWLNKTYKSGIGEISDGKNTFKFKGIPDGIYGVSLFHDENNNGKLDTNFMGIPKEDTGSSNDAPARFGPPEWMAAKFEVKGETVKLIINL